MRFERCKDLMNPEKAGDSLDLIQDSKKISIFGNWKQKEHESWI